MGFIVSQRGIELDLGKLRAIQSMHAPRTEKEVCGFLWRLNYIASFISHLTATCKPIFKLLNKDQVIKWIEDYQVALDKLKNICNNHQSWYPLIMYLTILDEPMGCVLGQQHETGRKEKVIYYINNKFKECETRYSLLKKTCCALAWFARRLRQYMLTHTTWLMSKMDPIKYIFKKLALTRIISRWKILLSK